MPEPVPSQRFSKTEVLDVTGTYTPRFDQPEHNVEDADQIENVETRFESTMVVLGEVWAALQDVLFQREGIRVADFDDVKVELVVFRNENDSIKQFGISDVISGKIRLDPSTTKTIESLIDTLAHEFVHFAARRKILRRDNFVTGARTGLSLSVSFDDPEKANDIGLGLLDEALTEIAKTSLLNEAIKQIPSLRNTQFVPNSYIEARAFYKELVDNLVLAWNKPTLRVKGPHQLLPDKIFLIMFGKNAAQWSDRVFVLQDELGWPNRITSQQVENLFESSLWDKFAIPKIARLMNTMLGERAFQELVNLSVRVDPTEPKGWEYEVMKSIVTMPSSLP